MNLNDLANLGQIVGAIGVMITLIYLAIQIRGNTRVASAQARHAISEFVMMKIGLGMQQKFLAC